MSPAPSSEAHTLVGTPMPALALPTTQARRVVDRGPYLTDLRHKRAEEALDYWVDMSTWLQPHETIERVEATATDPRLILFRLGFDDRHAILWLAGGRDRARHIVRLTVKTSLGATKVFEFALRVDGEADFVLVRVDAFPGFVVGSPLPFSLTPTALAFGSVEIGSAGHTLTTTLVRAGDGDLVVTALSVSGDFGVTTAVPTTVPAGGTLAVPVTFTPGTVGVHAGVLTVTTGQGSATVDLSGLGVEPSPALAATLLPATLVYPATLVGVIAQPLVATLTNTGEANLAVTAATATGDFTVLPDWPSTLVAGQAHGFAVRFQPRGEGERTGILSVTTGAGPLTVDLAGTGLPLPDVRTATLTPASITFPETVVGTVSAARIATLTNTGTVALTIASAAATAPFVVAAGWPGVLDPGGSVGFDLTFEPQAAGAASAAAGFEVATDFGTFRVELSATAIDPAPVLAASVTPGALTFPATTVDTTSAPLTATLTNTGECTVTVSSATVDGDFVLAPGWSGVLAAGAATAFEIAFRPAAEGSRSGTLTVVTNAGSHAVSLSGTGEAVAPPDPPPPVSIGDPPPA